MELQNRDPFKGLIPQSRIFRHVLFWVWLYLMDVVVFGIGYENVQLFLKLALLEMPGQMFLAYLIMYWIMPRYLSGKSAIEALGVSLIAFFICGIFSHWLFIASSSYTTQESLLDIPKILLRGIYCFLKACIFIGARMAILWHQNERRIASLQKHKLESELKMLKDQVNPHFMFNTLNNLYGLAGRDPVQAQESILRLSGILQFMLHESNFAAIPVQAEIKCIQDYIALEKLRYSEALAVSMNVNEEVYKLSIAPLTLFPFVENAFKHGASEAIHHSVINIDVSIFEDSFIFKVANSKRNTGRENGFHGIGLKNVKRRLELVYEGDHQLQITQDPENFLVVVKIALHRMTEQETRNYESKMSDR
jgi:two-component system, LytTR family, sensor kinase